jgi:hypothetical protein
VAPEVGGKLVPGDSVWGGMSSGIRIPPSGCGPLKSSCSIQDLLSVITLTGSEHLQHYLQPILNFKRISGMSEHGGGGGDTLNPGVCCGAQAVAPVDC